MFRRHGSFEGQVLTEMLTKNKPLHELAVHSGPTYGMASERSFDKHGRHAAADQLLYLAKSGKPAVLLRQ